LLALSVAVKPDVALTLRLGKHCRGAQFAFPAVKGEGAMDPITPTSPIVAKARPASPRTSPTDPASLFPDLVNALLQPLLGQPPPAR